MFPTPLRIRERPHISGVWPYSVSAMLGILVFLGVIFTIASLCRAVDKSSINPLLHHAAETRIIEQCALSLGFPLSVGSRNCFFLSRKGERGCDFAVIFALSGEGKFGLHSTRFNYSSFCGIGV